MQAFLLWESLYWGGKEGGGQGGPFFFFCQERYPTRECVIWAIEPDRVGLFPKTKKNRTGGRRLDALQVGPMKS